MSFRDPAYRFHKARNCAVVTIGGRDHYFGAYNSPASLEKYHRLVAEHFADRAQPLPQVDDHETPLTLVGLIARYWRHAKTYYVKDAKPTSEQASIRHALRFVRRLCGSTPAREFSPKKLKAVREAMIAHMIMRRYKVRDPETGTVDWAEKVLHRGLARHTINRQIGRIKRMFAWVKWQAG